MELDLREAGGRLPELVNAARQGGRVVITKDGEPAVELVRCPKRKRGGVDFDKLEATCKRLGLSGDGERWPEEFNDPAFSRQALGLDEDDE